MKRYLVKNLLPGHNDGLTGEENAEEIGDFPQKRKTGIHQKRIMITVSACIAVLAGFLIFAINYDIPLPFDPNRMSVELYKMAVITNDDGTVSWREINPVLLGNIIPEDSGNIIEAAQLTYHGINNIGGTAAGRTIKRNGKEIRVVYYCYTKTLWNSLLIDPDLLGYSESGRGFCSQIYGDDYQSADYEPHMREIYYLPVKNQEKFENLSDEEYDELREKGELIWSGVI